MVGIKRGGASQEALNKHRLFIPHRSWIYEKFHDALRFFRFSFPTAPDPWGTWSHDRRQFSILSMTLGTGHLVVGLAYWHFLRRPARKQSRIPDQLPGFAPDG